MSFPVGNYIPKKINLELNNYSNIVDLIIYQDHSNRFYDTSIGIKSKLSKSKNLTTILETKSINGFSLNKNIIFNFNKINEDMIIDFSYMHHDENIPTYVSIDNYYNRNNEFYALGFKIDFDNLNLNILHQFNYQFSDYTFNNNINLNDNVLWNHFNFEYIFNNYIFFIDLDYKKNTIDISDNQQSQIDSLLSNEAEFNDEIYFSLSSLGFKYFNANHNVSFGIVDILNSDYKFSHKIEPCFDYKYKYLNFSFDIVRKIIPYNNVKGIFNHSTNYYNKSYIGIYYKNKDIKQSFSFGIIKENENSYNYFSYAGSFDYKWIKSEYDFKIFEKDVFYINNSFNFSLGFYPKINNKSFDIFIKIHGNHLNLNASYEIDFSTLSLFSSTNISGNDNVNIFDGEIGIMFKDFKISFIRENIMSALYYYNNDFLFPNRSNYLINIEWIFNE